MTKIEYSSSREKVRWESEKPENILWEVFSLSTVTRSMSRRVPQKGEQSELNARKFLISKRNIYWEETACVTRLLFKCFPFTFRAWDIFKKSLTYYILVGKRVKVTENVREGFHVALDFLLSGFFLLPSPIYIVDFNSSMCLTRNLTCLSQLRKEEEKFPRLSWLSLCRRDRRKRNSYHDNQETQEVKVGESSSQRQLMPHVWLSAFFTTIERI